MNPARLIKSVVLILCAALCSAPVYAQDAKRSITQIKDGLYLFQNNFHNTVFLVTPEGIVATDPINADAAQWLKSELAKRFDQPVKYLIYSHDHVDHIAGGEVFGDAVTIIAHDSAKSDIIGENRPTAVPDITFSEQLTLELGGKTVELTYVGKSHSDNMIVMRFPDERTLFVVDIIPIKTVAWRNMTDAYLPDWMEAIRRVEAMDFDILAPGHGPLGGKADAVAYREYMEELYTAVLQAAREGKSLEQMQQTIKMENYADWGNYDAHLPLNIEGMYNQIMLHRRGN